MVFANLNGCGLSSFNIIYFHYEDNKVDFKTKVCKPQFDWWIVVCYKIHTKVLIFQISNLL